MNHTQPMIKFETSIGIVCMSIDTLTLDLEKKNVQHRCRDLVHCVLSFDKRASAAKNRIQRHLATYNVITLINFIMTVPVQAETSERVRQRERASERGYEEWCVDA